MSSTHKSAMGKAIDMSAIRARNENVRAVGNMQVNARGDTIDKTNKVTDRVGQRVNRVYSKSTMNPTAVVKETMPQTTSPRPAPALNQPTVQLSSPTIAKPAPSAPVVEYEDATPEELAMFSELDDEPVKSQDKSKKK